MELLAGYIDLNPQNVNFLYDVIHNPISLSALIVAFLVVVFAFRPFFAKRNLSRVMLLVAILILALVAFFTR